MKNDDITMVLEAAISVLIVIMLMIELCILGVVVVRIM